ncbi:glycosyl hydrolase [Aquimarina aggregata]|uniref:glycosyl hydrolase n=1 Tax=Aquimarina aggregata TaxID=1642818 RepID=UPI002490C7FD|nr:glycosyl hydrolase [Aquimarina aggregata]
MLKNQKKYFYLCALVGLMSCSIDKDSSTEEIEAEIDNSTISVEKVKKEPYFVGKNPTPRGKKWKTVYKLTDEFNSDKINSKKWYTDPSKHPHLKWPGRLPALFQEKRIKTNKGKMTIEVGKLSKPITINPYGEPLTYDYYGGILRSKATSTIGNYYECRMKMSKTEMGGGFWLMGFNRECNKKHEIDITESVGVLTPLTAEWAKRAKWDEIYHSNAIRREDKCDSNSERDQGAITTPTKNHERYYVYGFWWKSATELVFYLDGEYQYTLTPPVPFNEQMYLQFSIESYDWNPIPVNGSKVANAKLKDRTCYVDYIRTFKLVNQ